MGDFHARRSTVCKGNCTDFHARFIGRGSSGLGDPGALHHGRAAQAPGQDAAYNSYHCWAHWYDGEHWHPVDISEADKVVDKDPAKAEWFFGNLGENRVALTFGRDITLAPAQTGPKLNYFVFPYAEADGEPVAMNKNDNWVFTWSDL